MAATARRTRRVPRPSLPPHAYTPADLPPDWEGRRPCAECQKPGRDGDAQHPLGALPLAQARYPTVPAGVTAHEARLLGEHADE